MKIYSRRIRCDAMALNKLTVSPFYHHITVCIQYKIVHLNGLSIVGVRIVRTFLLSFLLAGWHDTLKPHSAWWSPPLHMHMGKMLDLTVCYLSTITPMKPFQCLCHRYTLCALHCERCVMCIQMVYNESQWVLFNLSFVRFVENGKKTHTNPYKPTQRTAHNTHTIFHQKMFHAKSTHAHRISLVEHRIALQTHVPKQRIQNTVWKPVFGCKFIICCISGEQHIA